MYVHGNYTLTMFMKRISAGNQNAEQLSVISFNLLSCLLSCLLNNCTFVLTDPYIHNYIAT